jgi:IclR family transcriptional regulator, acetate operon repressor
MDARGALGRPRRSGLRDQVGTVGEAKPAREDDVRSVSRAFEVLEFIVQAPEPPTFPELTAALSMPKSSLHYLLLTLARRGYLEQSGRQGGYIPGPALQEMSQRVLNPEGPRSIARRLIREMGDTLNEAVAYYELNGEGAEVVLLESPRQPLQINMVLGTTSPLHASAAGKMLLACMSDTGVDAFLDRKKLPQLTPTTLTAPAKLRKEIADIRRAGIAYAREEHIAGVIGTAMAMRHGETVVGAIGVGVPTVRYTPELADKIVEQLSLASARFQREAALLDSTPERR